MSTTKHTPGPWFASDMVGETGAEPNSIWIGNKDGYIAQVTREDGLTQKDWLDAALIAAAPELLDCLIDLLDADGDLYAMDFNRYRAAVAAAKGGVDEILEDDES